MAFPGGARRQLTFYRERAAIKKNGGPVWFLMARDEGHGFSKKTNQNYQFYATLKFVEDHLLKSGGRTRSSFRGGI